IVKLRNLYKKETSCMQNPYTAKFVKINMAATFYATPDILENLRHRIVETVNLITRNQLPRRRGRKKQELTKKEMFCS
ncbi:hypothetical protein L9F63_019377, partial [Diploptera punctata]